MAGDGWAAQLVLGFDRAGERTILRDRRHSGPLQVQRPFYPEGESVCHVYVLHPPGGVVGGDSLAISVTTVTGSHALITTPAAGKFYRSSGPWAEVQQTIRVGRGAVVEWLPQETIVYNGAKVRATTRIELEEGARFLGWEVACLGLPASGQEFEQGDCRQSFEVWLKGAPLLMERGRFEGGSEALRAPWGLGGHTVSGCLVSTVNDSALLDRIRREKCEALAHLGESPHIFSPSLARGAEGRGMSGPRGLTHPLTPSRQGRGNSCPVALEEELLTTTIVNGLMVCRYLGRDGFRAMQYFASVWEVLRPALCNRPACPPRIWRT